MAEGQCAECREVRGNITNKKIREKTGLEDTLVVAGVLLAVVGMSIYVNASEDFRRLCCNLTNKPYHPYFA